MGDERPFYTSTFFSAMIPRFCGFDESRAGSVVQFISVMMSAMGLFLVEGSRSQDDPAQLYNSIRVCVGQHFRYIQYVSLNWVFRKS